MEKITPYIIYIKCQRDPNAKIKVERRILQICLLHCARSTPCGRAEGLLLLAQTDDKVLRSSHIHFAIGAAGLGCIGRTRRGGCRGIVIAHMERQKRRLLLMALLLLLLRIVGEQTP